MLKVLSKYFLNTTFLNAVGLSFRFDLSSLLKKMENKAISQNTVDMF